MPVEFERLGLGESPWEHVRAHVFEWEHEGNARKSGARKVKARKAGRHSPSRYNQPEGHPASCLQPQQVALVIRIVLEIIITEEIIGVRIAQRQAQRILQRRTRRLAAQLSHDAVQQLIRLS